MSRSVKKTSVFKDGGHYRKKIASRKLRRINKVEVATGREFLSKPDEVMNPYDICDYKYLPDKKSPLYKKGLRK